MELACVTAQTSKKIVLLAFYVTAWFQENAERIAVLSTTVKPVLK